ncbi:LCP family protein [Amycolatopsis sp. YIM 10]|uniref:LCP family protein n=1 Tax=Amycolatopsis sp. YIM 10 TaxID=2653857 RepID=UPI00129014BE|nr:LCP family protein [Amycolatopsis sp. YIM 10]
MDHPPRDDRGARRPARPWQDESPARPRPASTPPRDRGLPPRRPPAGGARPPVRRPEARRPAPPPPPPPKRSRRGVKIALALVSLLVMSLTGYAWAAMQGLVSGLTTTDVIASDAGGDKPADGARDILLVGMDSRTDAQGNPLPKEVLAQLRAGAADGELNTDTLIFVHIPNDGSKAVAISLPRDSYVDIPGGYGKHKINSAYARAKTDSRRKLESEGVTNPQDLELRSNQEGAKTLVATVEKLTGSKIDNYASINLLGFHDVTTAIGGVDVCLNDAVKDEFSGANFKKGPQSISGADALAFVRQRHGLPRGDLDRVVRQQVFMAGLARKVLSAGTLADPVKLNDLAGALQKSVVLNQGWDIVGFAQQMRGLTGGQLEFRTIPVVNMDYTTPNDGSAIQVDPGEVKKFVQGLAGPPAPEAPGPNADNAKTTVDVRNASGVTGLAAKVSEALTGKGFTAGETSNSSSRKTSVVRYGTGGQAAGQAVADALGGQLSVEEDPTVTAGHVTVYVGSDYSGAGTASQASGSTPARQFTAPQPQQPPAQPDGSAEQPITADGVTCVN